MRKMMLAVGFGAGYVLGTKAGRARYEQIMRYVRGVKENPTVQETAGVVQAQATNLYSTAKDKVGSKVQQTSGGSTGGEMGSSMGSSAESSTGLSSTETSAYPDYSAGSNGVVR